MHINKYNIGCECNSKSLLMYCKMITMANTMWVAGVTRSDVRRATASMRLSDFSLALSKFGGRANHARCGEGKTVAAYSALGPLSPLSLSSSASLLRSRKGAPLLRSKFGNSYYRYYTSYNTFYGILFFFFILHKTLIRCHFLNHYVICYQDIKFDYICTFCNT